MTIEYWTDDDTIYVSCDALCVGDYGGSGSVGEANIRSLSSREDVIVRHGPHGYRQAWLVVNDDNVALCRSLDEQYPLIDEEEESRVRDEWEWEAWEGWLQSDLNRTLPDGLGEVIDDDLSSEEQWEAYREAMEASNNYPIPEYNGICVRLTPDLREAYFQAVYSRLTAKQ